MVGKRTDGFTVSVEISPGELIDKMIILEIKTERITVGDKLQCVRWELAALSSSHAKLIPRSAELQSLTTDLKTVNELLWDAENEIRACEATKDFGAHFVDLARSVYRSNDQRAALKRKINDLLGSSLIEVKEYPPYD